MVARANDPAEAARRPRGWTLHTLPADEAGFLSPEEPQVGAEAEAEASSDLCGRLLGARYDVRELLSHGERGAVYLADDRNYGRTVVLRITAPSAIEAGEDVRGRARRRMGVRHMHLAAVQGEGLTEGGLHFVAMEHVEGRNLHHMLGDPRLVWPAVLAIGTQVAEALVALHGAWVVHGRVHPGNLVWVDDPTRAVHVKLVDLDVSAGTAAGYVAPGFGGVEADTSGDVFALAATLYELCTGGLPDAGLSGLAAHPEVPAWFAELLRSVLQGGLGIPSARVVLASLRSGAGQDAPVSAVESAAAPGPVDLPAVPVAVVRAPSGALIMPPIVVPSGPLPAAAPVVLAVPLPAAVVMPTVPPVAGAMPALATPEPTPTPTPRPTGPAPGPSTRPSIVMMPPPPTGPMPVVPPGAAGESEDDLWFAAVEAFDPLARIEAIAAAEDGAVAPPPEFGGAADSIEQAPAMVTMTAAFDPQPTPVLEVATASDSVSTFVPGAAPAAGPGRWRGRVIAAVAAVIVLAFVAWRLAAGSASDAGGDRAAPPVAAPVKAADGAKPAVSVMPAPGATRPKPTGPSPASPGPSPASPGPSPASPGPSAPVTTATNPATDAGPTGSGGDAGGPAGADEAEVEEPGPPGATREKLSAAEFRQVMLRANRSPAVIDCYMQHTAGVEQKVEIVARVGARGRVHKTRVEDGPLGECLRKVVERLDFPAAQESAQHQYVFRSPIE